MSEQEGCRQVKRLGGGTEASNRVEASPRGKFLEKVGESDCRQLSRPNARRFEGVLESLSTKEKSYIQRKGGAEPTFKPRVAEKQRVIDVVLDVKIKGNFRGAASLTVERETPGQAMWAKERRTKE